MTPSDCSTCRFLGDATAARDALSALRDAADAARADLAPLTEAAADLAADVDDHRTALATLRTEATALRTAEGDLAVLRSRIDTAARAGAALDAARLRVTAAAADVLTANEAALTAEAALAAIVTEGRTARATASTLTGADLDLRRLDVALGSAAHLRTAHAAAVARRGALEASIAALGTPLDLSAQRRALAALAETEASARRERDARRAEARAAAARLERARGALDQLGDLDARADELTTTRDRLALRRAGFAELERAFGRDGIQALEIDAAGPEVSRLTNELLATVSGGRFAVSLVTLQEASGARKQREVFDLRVLDGDREHAGIAFDRMSIGEQCLVGEALKLAIAVHNTRRSGRELRTLYRDEGDRDLDPERRAAYPAMLRRAMELGGFTRCFLISHAAEVWAQADAVIRVEGGRAWIER